jgi:hypothetical protein
MDLSSLLQPGKFLRCNGWCRFASQSFEALFHTDIFLRHFWRGGRWRDRGFWRFG